MTNFGFESLASVSGGLNYLGTWNATTNSPLIQSGVGTSGDYYIVDVAGTTNIDGISDWGIGDWIIFSSTGVWQKIDNSEVTATTIYNADSTLSGNRTVTMAGNTLNFDGGKVGVNVTPSTPLQVRGTAVPSSNESLARFEVSDSTAYLQIANGTASNSEFIPQIQGRQSASSTSSAVNLAGIIDSTQDSGSTPVTVFSSFLSSLAAVVTRPVFQFSNWTTKLLTILANGNVGIGTTTPSEKLEVSGKTKTTTFQMTTTPTNGYVMTSDASGNGSWDAPPSSSIPQTDVIYVDSVAGVNDLTADRGQIQKPYATVEYALANTTNTGTVTGDTTNGNNTITNVSSTTNIKVGQYITGTNIPYNSIVVSKTANTIVLSKTATGTGTGLTLTWWTIKTINLISDIVATSNWFKAGFWFDCGDKNITWGNFRLFDKTVNGLIPEYVKGGNWHGNNANSVFMYSNVGGSNDLYVDIISYYSIGTGNQLFIQQFQSVYRNITFKCQSFDARFGSIGFLWATGLTIVEGNFYGLTGGIQLPGSSVVNAYIETPASVNAFIGRFGYYTINATILGSVSTSLDGQTKSFNLNGSIKGTTVSLANGGQYFLGSNINGDIECTNLTVTSSNYETLINGRVSGNVTLNGGVLKIASFYGGTLTVSGASSKAYITSTVVYSDTKWYGNISLTSGGTLYWYGSADFGTPTAAYIFPTLSIASGCVVHIYGKLMAEITSLAGTLNVYSSGYLWSIKKTPAITGSLNNYGGIIELTRNGYLNTTESATTTPTIDISTGTYLQDGGTLFCTNADSKSGLIRKTASGGKVVLKGQPYLKVANGLAPLQILSNTGTAQNVLDFSMVGNGAAGFRLSDTFSDTTYGTAYAPNLLVGGTRYEDTTYSF